jgi:hypothetical protein
MIIRVSFHMVNISLILSLPRLLVRTVVFVVARFSPWQGA